MADAQLDGGRAKLINRIHKVVDQRDAERNKRLELQSRLEALEAQLEGHRTTPAAPAGADVSGDPDVRGMTQRIAQVKATLAQVEEHPEGGAVTFDGKTYEVPADKMGGLRLALQEELTDLTSQRSVRVALLRRDWERDQANYEAQAAAAYPAVADTRSAEYQGIQQMLRQLPEIRRFPDYQLWLADALAGRAARVARENGRAQPSRRPPAPAAAPARPAPVVTQSASALPDEAGTVDGDNRRSQVRKQQFMKSGRLNDLKEWIAQSRRTARSRANT